MSLLSVAKRTNFISGALKYPGLPSTTWSDYNLFRNLLLDKYGGLVAAVASGFLYRSSSLGGSLSYVTNLNGNGSQNVTSMAVDAQGVFYYATEDNKIYAIPEITTPYTHPVILNNMTFVANKLAVNSAGNLGICTTSYNYVPNAALVIFSNTTAGNSGAQSGWTVTQYPHSVGTVLSDSSVTTVNWTAYNSNLDAFFVGSWNNSSSSLILGKLTNLDASGQTATLTRYTVDGLSSPSDFNLGTFSSLVFVTNTKAYVTFGTGNQSVKSITLNNTDNTATSASSNGITNIANNPLPNYGTPLYTYSAVGDTYSTYYFSDTTNGISYHVSYYL